MHKLIVFVLSLLAVLASSQGPRKAPYLIPTDTTCPRRDLWVAIVAQNSFDYSVFGEDFEEVPRNIGGALGVLHGLHQGFDDRDNLMELSGYWASNQNGVETRTAAEMASRSFPSSVTEPYPSGAAINAALTRVRNDVNTARTVPATAAAARNAVVVLVRHDLRQADLYQPTAALLQGMGVRIITVEVNISRAAGIATRTASSPAARHVVPLDFSVPGIVFDSPLIKVVGQVVQRVRGDLGATCVMHGRTTVDTYDGQRFAHAGIGDYVLLRTLGQEPIEVQVRKTQCDNEPFRRSACVSGVAVSMPAMPLKYTVQYDREHNDVVVVMNGKLTPVESLDDFRAEMGPVIHRLEPDVGLRVELMINNGNTLCTVTFFTDPEKDTLVVVSPLFDMWTRVAGICGTWDACPDNDFIGADLEIHESAEASTDTWRVMGGASLFEWAQYSADVMDPAAYNLRQPLYETGWTSQARHKNDVPEQFADEVLYELCDEYCTSGGWSAVASLNNATHWENMDEDDKPCKGLCDTQADDLLALRWGPFAREYGTKGYVPPVNVALENRGAVGAVNFPFEGQYVFEVKEEDCCDDKSVNASKITVNVKCTNPDFKVDAGKAVEPVGMPYPLPEVRLEAKLKGIEAKNVFITWRNVASPEYPLRPGDGYEFMAKIRYPHSLTPSVQVLIPGTYTFEVSVFDGCHVATSTVNVTTPCFSELGFVAEAQDVDIVWSGNAFPKAIVEYGQRCPVIAPLGKMFNFGTPVPFISELSHKPADAPVTQFAQATGSDTYELFWEYTSDVSHSVEEFNTTFADTKTTKPPQPLGCHNGICRAEGSNIVIEERLNVAIDIAVEHNWFNVSRGVECTLDPQASTSGLTSSSTEVTFTPTDMGDYPTSDELPEWLDADTRAVAEKTMPFGFGRCEGTYHVKTDLVAVMQCGNKTDEYDVAVGCRPVWKTPVSNPLTPCHPVMFNFNPRTDITMAKWLWSSNSRLWYRDNVYPPIGFVFLLDGRDSSSYNREHLWQLVNRPNTTYEVWQGTPGQPKDDELQQTTTENAYEPGTYEYLLSSTDRCNVDHEPFEVLAECPKLQIVGNVVCPPSTILFDYINASNPLMHPGISVEVDKKNATLYPGYSVEILWTVLLENGTEFGPWEFGSVLPDSQSTRLDIAAILSELHSRGIFTTTFKITPVVKDRCQTIRPAAPCQVAVNCGETMTITEKTINTTLYCVPNLSGTCTNDRMHFSGNASSNLDASGESFSPIWDFGSGVTSTQWAGSVGVASAPLGVNNATFTVFHGACAHATTGRMEYTVMCATNVLTPYIKFENSGGAHVPFGVAWLATSSESTSGEFRGARMPGPFSPQWELKDMDGKVIRQSSSAVFNYSPEPVEATYNLTLTMSDGCKSATVSVLLVVVCDDTIHAQAEMVSSAPVWLGNKFPLVSLTGKDTTVPPANRSDITVYEWIFLDTPFASIFRGKYNVHEESLGQTTSVTTTRKENELYLGSSSITYQHYTNITTTNTTKVSGLYRRTEYTVLQNPAAGSDVFGTCFRPDVEGKYRLQLSMRKGCTWSTDEIVVEAKCNGKPKIEKELPKVGTVWERLQFDGTTTDPDGDSLSYKWTMTRCDGVDPIDVTSELTNQQSPKAFWTPVEAGKYCVTLEVSDGCGDPITKPFEITVGCKAPVEGLEPLEDQEKAVKLSGKGVEVVRIELDIDEDIQDEKWFDSHSYSWTLVDYSRKF